MNFKAEQSEFSKMLEDTWPPKKVIRLDDWTIRISEGAGKRASAISLEGIWEETSFKRLKNLLIKLGKSEIFGNKNGDLLILSWGGTRGACRSAVEALRAKKKKVSHLHIRWINPLPKDLGEILIKFKNVLMPEINSGQLSKIIRAEFLVDVKGLNLVRGKPISSADIQQAANSLIG